MTKEMMKYEFAWGEIELKWLLVMFCWAPTEQSDLSFVVLDRSVKVLFNSKKYVSRSDAKVK